VNRHQLRVRFEHEESVVETHEPVTVVDPTAWSSPDATVFAEGAFASALAREGLSVTHDIEAASVAFVDRISEDVAQFAADGGDVVQIPVDGGEMIRSGPFTFQDVPEPETWIGTASFLYQQSSLCADICARSRLGWEFEGLYPSAVATDLDPTGDDIHAGYVEGWVANWGSPLVTREYGSGSITALTFDVRDAYGTHPIATPLVNRIVQTVSE
jgi:hypothetical protein